ncbi:MAG: AAA family ATPase, partial [Alphaproteobacteria bacterium]|nr:AAA family ATPase [Alphaproteobacteria bacterium]
MTAKPFSPREIVSELDRHIIGQNEAKRAVAIALRNRWRRQQLPENLRDEVLPKNILMIGPTGVGKTEIARRLARLAQAPFLKVEATKFTEVGYVGRDVEQIPRDLLEIAIGTVRERLRRDVSAKAEIAAEERVLDALVGETATGETRQKFRKMLREGKLDDKEIEVQIADGSGLQLPTIDIPGMPGAQMGMLNLGDMLGKAFGGRAKPRRLTVAAALKALHQEESDKLVDNDRVLREARELTEQHGIVF